MDLVILVAAAAAIGVCFAKGKPWFAVLGLLLSPFAIVGAIRIAKPGSWWARRNYVAGSVKDQISRHRFPEAVIKTELPSNN